MNRVFSLADKWHGTGPIIFCWQKPQGNCIASSGVNNLVNIFDRHGDLKEQVQLQGRCCELTWDKDGDVLAMINDKTSQIVLWDANTYKSAHLEVSFKEPLSVLVWSKVSMCLAVGTTKGNLLIYNHRSARKIPIVGKHSKKITCGCWSDQDLLAMAGEDKMLTISNAEGDTVRQITLRHEPMDIQFSEMKQDERSSGENTISLIVGKKTLFLYNLNDPENPIELAFQQRYGNIATYKWFGDGYILIGFSQGYFVVISTHMKEIGQELHQSRNHKGNLSHVAVNTTIGKAASSGDNTVKIHELADPKETYAVVTVDDEQSVDRLEWTEDGQLLAVSTPQGTVHVYLTRLPILGHAYNTRLIYLTSLLEVTITDNVEKEKPVTITAEVEPSFLSLGPYHFALGMNNRAWFYSFGETGPELVGDREYLGTVQSMKMNADYACVLHEGKLQLHVIETESGAENEGRETLMLPDAEHVGVRINCLALTADFLIYGTDGGGLFNFLLEDWQNVNEYHHSHSIRKIYPDPAGVRLIFVDEKSDGYIYNPVNDVVIEIPNMPGKVQSVIWDKAPFEKGVFIAYDEEKIYTFIYVQEHIRGTKVSLIGATLLPAGQYPILLYGGELTCQTQGGKIANLTLSTHDLGGKVRGHSKDEAGQALFKCLALRRFKDAWALCLQNDEPEKWQLLAKTALENMDLDTATEVYRHIRDVGMVFSLDGVRGTEDRHLLAGHVAMFLGEFDLAQELYLNSGEPSAALDMRRDLLQWDLALQLATKLAPHQVANISREYAQQLEFVGEYSSALMHYEKGMVSGAEHAEDNELCQNGIAKMSIRCGDIRKGVMMAEQLPNPTVKKECAEILETIKQYAEAAVLFEKGGCPDRAASLYIRLKNWQKIGDLLPNITAPKILLQYAKAKEADGRYKEAADAYERARDYDNLTRILLDHLKNPEKAVKVVKESQSVEGAKMVARFFQKLNDFSSAIQFLVMSKCNDEAFRLAQQYGKMSVYTEVLGNGAIDEYKSVAHYYENEKNHHEAGKFYFLAKDYPKALKHLLKVSGKEENAAISLATDVVGEAQDVALTQQLIGFLLGEADGVPKDAKHLFKLYMACRQYREAAKTASIIAREEQNAGNYRNAHDVLFSMFQELRRHSIKIPAEMVAGLMILHSYILVKIQVKRGEHLRAARMLVRVANNISKFPAHVVPILTSTIIECHRSGLKNSAFSYATMLMRPEYRNQIDLKYKKKIEAIVRKPQKTEEEEECSPCPYCSNQLPATELFCSECKNNLPYCIVTGQHVTLRDLTVCPKCRFPATLAEFIKHLEYDTVCPMCSESVSPRDLSKIADAAQILQQEID